MERAWSIFRPQSSRREPDKAVVEVGGLFTALVIVLSMRHQRLEESSVGPCPRQTVHVICWKVAVGRGQIALRWKAPTVAPVFRYAEH